MTSGVTKSLPELTVFQRLHTPSEDHRMIQSITYLNYRFWIVAKQCLLGLVNNILKWSKHDKCAYRDIQTTMVCDKWLIQSFCMQCSYMPTHIFETMQSGHAGFLNHNSVIFLCGCCNMTKQSRHVQKSLRQQSNSTLIQVFVFSWLFFMITGWFVSIPVQQ